MTDSIILIVPITILALFICVFTYSSIVDNKKLPTQYVWRNVWPDYKGEWERGRVTSVYLQQDTNEIRAKVVGQSDGLYLATMWNGQDKEFMFDYEAKKWVEEYKPRVYK